MLASIQATCQECDRSFPPQEGGICGRCGRLLCGWHLHGFGGSLRQLFRGGAGGEQVICVRCGREPSRDSPPA